MADYQTPPTVTGTDLLTSAAWNTYVRDNLEVVGRPPSLSLYLTSDTTYNGYTSNIDWDAAEWQTDSAMWSAATNPNQVTITVDGWYLVLTEIRCTSTYSTTWTYSSVYVDGGADANLINGSPRLFTATCQGFSGTRYTYLYLTSGQTLDAKTYWDGAGVNVYTLEAGTRFTVAWSYA